MKFNVSAREINSFVFCPYQWYYERVYGKARISEMRRELLGNTGRIDPTKSAFARGNEYHEKFLPRMRMRFALIAILISALILGALWVVLYMRGAGIW